MDKEKHDGNKNSVANKSSKESEKDTNTISKQNDEVFGEDGEQKSKD